MDVSQAVMVRELDFVSSQRELTVLPAVFTTSILLENDYHYYLLIASAN